MTDVSSTIATASFTATIEQIEGECVVLAVQDNAYRLRFAWKGASAPSVGRIKGTIRVHALRVHAAASGGRFIEPVIGAPRIVAGRVDAIDAHSATISVRSVVPMHVALERREDLAACSIGSLVYFHVRSDSAFVPEPAA